MKVIEWKLFFQYVLKTVKSIPELKHLAEALEHQMAEGSKALNSDEQTRKSPYNTICHRDFWMNNFMLRHDEEGNPEKIRIVDYQMTSFNTCVQDLLFLLFSSVENEVVEKNLNNFIEIYYNEFYWSLMTNGCPMEEFSWDRFAIIIIEEIFVVFWYFLPRFQFPGRAKWDCTVRIKPHSGNGQSAYVGQQEIGRSVAGGRINSDGYDCKWWVDESGVLYEVQDDFVGLWETELVVEVKGALTCKFG